MPRRPPISPLFPYTTLFRSDAADRRALHAVEPGDGARRHEDSRALRLRESDPILAAEQRAAGEHDEVAAGAERLRDRKSTRLNSSHTVISYAVFCLKKKKKS